MVKMTDKEIEISIELYNKGWQFKRIGKYLGRSGTSISRKLGKLGVYTVIEKKTCPECQNDFKPARTNSQRQMYCAEPCRQKANQRRRYRPRELNVRTCEECGEDFKTSSKKATVCSEECRTMEARKKRNRNKKLRAYKCKECDKTRFSTRNRSYCSRTCQDRFNSRCRRKKKQYVNKRVRKCIYCGYWHTFNRLCCSNECSKKHSRRNSTLLKEKRMIKARQNGQFDADIDIYKLIDRDGQECYLCAEKVSFKKHYNDLKYPTIEHVIAISNGGTHSWDNVKVACRDCNNKKGTKMLETGVNV